MPVRKQFGDIDEMQYLRTEVHQLMHQNEQLKRQAAHNDTKNQELRNAGQRTAILRMLQIVHSDKRIMSQDDIVLALIEMLRDVSNKQHATRTDAQKKRKL
jgi:hypothetical protein